MNVEYAKNPIQNQNGTINLTVKFKEFPMEVEFTASPNDSAEHGRVLFNNASQGIYGAIRSD